VALDLDHIRDRLEAEKGRLLDAVGGVNHRRSLEEETGDLSIGTDDHIADSATDTMMRELDGGLEENAEHLLAEVNGALARLDDGTYGTCTACGAQIPDERLEAVPWASLCLDDKRRQEGG
jgi:DnaK suppressor protein